MRTKVWMTGLIGLVALSGWSGSALGTTAFTATAISTGQLSDPSNQAVVVGWTFTVTGSSNILVTQIGVYDEGEAGFATDHQVGIWHGSALVGSATVPAEAGGTCEAGYRYLVLDSPIELTADAVAYTIAVLFPVTCTDKYMVTADATFDSSGIVAPWWSTTLPGRYSRSVASSELIRPTAVISADQIGLNVNFKYSLVGAPVAVDDVCSTAINSLAAIDVLANDSDPEGDALSIDTFTQGTYGSVTLVGGGLVYTPNDDFVGTDSFTYTISDGNGHTATATVTVTVDPGTIAIDIKPGSYPNSINLGANGVVPVAVLSSETFDATALDPDTVFLEGAGVAIRGKGNRSMSHCEDVNGDGRADLVVQFDTENLVPGEFQDGMAQVTVEVTVETVTYLHYLGEDEITIVPALP